MFRKVLIANRGEIALRVLRCLRGMGVGSVAVYHHVDARSPVVASADEAVEITGTTPSAAHLDIAQLVRICRERGVDAVHPGYGFLAENADFARALAAAGIVFIGPTPEVMELMGDKIRSREFVRAHGFPVAPSVTRAADDPAFETELHMLGFPLVVKATAGGGGKGMSIVRDAAELGERMRVAASEAGKYFGNRQLYVERYIENARHIEVQVLGDGREVVHLGERECSIQRRFQKLVEEAPSPALDAPRRAAICEAARGIAQAAGYASAGTVEFLYADSGEFFFLEMNTRIQVEHPVTEMITGVDLVAEQIRIAAGEPLRLRQQDLRFSGHAIECRICAEDPDNDFQPQTGKVLRLREPAGPGVRVDSGLHEGQMITTAFDPMLAKLVVHGADRDEARERAIAALADFVLLGVRSNADWLSRVLAHEAFAAGATDTGFIARHAGALRAAPPDAATRHAVLAATLLGDRHMRRLFAATPQPWAAIGAWSN